MTSVLGRAIRFTVLVPGTIAGVVPAALGYATGGAWSAPFWRWLGLVPLALGLGLYGWTAGLFAVRGRGTPGPWDPPRRLVIEGPYRVSRNPMYVAVLAVILAQGVLWESAWTVGYGILVGAAFHLRVTQSEEPTLARQFGEDWRTYTRRTRRWI